MNSGDSWEFRNSRESPRSPKFLGQPAELPDTPSESSGSCSECLSKFLELTQIGRIVEQSPNFGETRGKNLKKSLVSRARALFKESQEWANPVIGGFFWDLPSEEPELHSVSARERAHPQFECWTVPLLDLHSLTHCICQRQNRENQRKSCAGMCCFCG